MTDREYLLQRLVEAEAEITRLRSANVALHDDGKALYRHRAMVETENRNLRGANAAANAIIAQQADEMKQIGDALAHAEAVLANVDSIYGTKSLEKLRELLTP